MLKTWGESVKPTFKRIWLPSQIMFSIFLEAWILSITIIVTLKTVSSGSVAMTYFWIASYVFIVLALLTLIRIKMEPKDDTAKILKTMATEISEMRREIRQLVEMHTPYRQPDIGLINKEIREGLKQINNQK